MRKKNIKLIGKDCYSCGGCAAICPVNCIDFDFSVQYGVFHPKINDEQCISCGKCLKVCPVKNDDALFQKNPFIGDFVSVYAAHSTDIELRQMAASGGFITAFLCYMLDNGYADGALVSRRDGIIGKSFLATNREDVISAKTSIYAPVDYSKGIEELLSSELKRIIVVGLPCHIQFISNLRKINEKLKEKILMTISILCGKTPTTNAYRYIARKNNFDYNSIKNVSNRGTGWPGYMRITYNGGEYKVSYRSNMSMGMVLSSPFFCNIGCLSCLDGVGVTADLVVCDAWSSKYTQHNSEGWNFVLVKTSIAQRFLDSDKIKEYLHIENESFVSFLSANRRVIEKARTGIHLRSNIYKKNKISYHLKLREYLYVFLMRRLMKIFYNQNKLKMNTSLLLFGKFINKLKG